MKMYLLESVNNGGMGGVQTNVFAPTLRLAKKTFAEMLPRDVKETLIDIKLVKESSFEALQKSMAQQGAEEAFLELIRGG